MTLSGCFSSKNSDTRRWNDVSKATKSHFSSVKSKTWKIVKYFLLLGVWTLPSELLLYVYLLCCLSFTHTHTHTHTLFTSPHHLEASHVFSFASLISSTQLAVFSWGKVNNFFHHLRALRCFDKVLLSISVSIKFMSYAFFNIEGLKNNAYFCAYKNEEWLLMQL